MKNKKLLHITPKNIEKEEKRGKKLKNWVI